MSSAPMSIAKIALGIQSSVPNTLNTLDIFDTLRSIKPYFNKTYVFPHINAIDIIANKIFAQHGITLTKDQIKTLLTDIYRRPALNNPEYTQIIKRIYPSVNKARRMLEKISPGHQCIKLYGNFINKICYICNRQIKADPPHDGECDHLLMLLDTILHLGLLQNDSSEYWNSIISAQKSLYKLVCKWAHKCENRVKGSISFIKRSKPGEYKVNKVNIIKYIKMMGKKAETNSFSKSCKSLRKKLFIDKRKVNSDVFGRIIGHFNPIITCINNQQEIIRIKCNLTNKESAQHAYEYAIGMSLFLKVPEFGMQGGSNGSEQNEILYDKYKNPYLDYIVDIICYQQTYLSNKDHLPIFRKSVHNFYESINTEIKVTDYHTNINNLTRLSIKRMLAFYNINEDNFVERVLQLDDNNSFLCLLLDITLKCIYSSGEKVFNLEIQPNSTKVTLQNIEPITSLGDIEPKPNENIMETIVEPNFNLDNSESDSDSDSEINETNLENDSNNKVDTIINHKLMHMPRYKLHMGSRSSSRVKSIGSRRRIRGISRQSAGSGTRYRKKLNKIISKKQRTLRNHNAAICPTKTRSAPRRLRRVLRRAHATRKAAARTRY